MTETFINDLADISWLYSTYIKDYFCGYGINLKREECNSAVFFGNEDSPEMIFVYREINPEFEKMPDGIFMLE